MIANEALSTINDKIIQFMINDNSFDFLSNIEKPQTMSTNGSMKNCLNFQKFLND